MHEAELDYATAVNSLKCIVLFDCVQSAIRFTGNLDTLQLHTQRCEHGRAGPFEKLRNFATVKAAVAEGYSVAPCCIGTIPLPKPRRRGR